MSGSVQAGAVAINMRVNLAKFKSGFSDGTAHTTRETRRMADDIKGQMREAKGSMMLLGEEVGIHIPRHLQTFIAKLPGVSTALSSAFNAVAVLAIIEVIVKVIEKIKEFKKAAEEAAKAGVKAHEEYIKTMVTSQAAIADLHAQFVGLTKGPIAEMEFRLAHVNELMSNMKLDEALTKQIDDIGKSLKTSWLEWGNDADKDFAKFAAAFKALPTPALKAEALSDKIAELQDKIANTHTGGTVGQNYIVGMQKEVEKLNELLGMVDAHQSQIAEKRKNDEQALANAKKDAANKGIADAEALRTKELAALDQMKAATDTLLAKEKTQFETREDALKKGIQAATEYEQAWEQAHKGISVVAHERILLLEKDLADVKRAEADAVRVGMIEAGGKEGKDIGKRLSTGENIKPTYTGGEHAMEMEKIRTSEDEAQKAAEKVKAAIEGQNDKFREQMQILDLLLAKHKLTPAEYKKATDELNGHAAAWKQLGSEVGKTIEQAALFSRSWKDALKAILIDLGQVLLKMAMMDSVNNGTMKSGGFVASLLGAFGGFRAAGGSVSPGQGYVVGEKHAEWFQPDTAGTIIPALPSAGSGDQMAVTNHFHFHNTNPDEFKRSSTQIGNHVSRSIQTAAQRNG